MNRRDITGDYFQWRIQSFLGVKLYTAGGEGNLRKIIQNYKYKIKYGILEEPMQVMSSIA